MAKTSTIKPVAAKQAMALLSMLGASVSKLAVALVRQH